MNEVSELSRQEQMIQHQIIQRGITEPRVLDALRYVPRERFFGRGNRDAAFDDAAASIGHGQTISQPYMVALMSYRLDVRPDSSVLEIGTGSGYQTAILARLAAKVYTVERVKPLLDEAWERLMQLGSRNVHFRFGDGTLGWPEAGPFDRILIAAGAPAVPERLLRAQLKDGGIAVMPVGDEKEQLLVEVHRKGDAFETIEVCTCRFVKLLGKEGWPDGDAAVDRG